MLTLKQFLDTLYKLLIDILGTFFFPLYNIPPPTLCFLNFRMRIDIRLINTVLNSHF